MPSLFVRFLPDTLPDKFDRSTNRVELTTELKDDSGSGSVLVRILRVVVLNVEAELFQQVVKRVLPFAVFTGKAKRNSVGEISDVLTVFENSIAEWMIAIRTREMLLVLFNGEISQVISDHYKECEFTSYLGDLSVVPPSRSGFGVFSVRKLDVLVHGDSSRRGTSCGTAAIGMRLLACLNVNRWQ